MDFKVNTLINGKSKYIEGYGEKILKIGGPVLILHTHKLFNIAVMEGFSLAWTQSLVIPIFKSGDKNDPSNY